MVFITPRLFQNEQHGKAWETSRKWWVVKKTMLIQNEHCNYCCIPHFGRQHNNNNGPTMINEQ
jgi:hypothetical protein